MNNFKRFYRNTKDRLFGYLIRLTGDYELSRDIMQESYTRYLERYRRRELRPSLLFTIARNRAMDHFRTRSRTEAIAQSEQGQCCEDQEHFYMVREEYRLVLRAMLQLPAQERDLLSMVVSSGLSYRDIAEVAGISEANVKVKIHRIRKKLNKIRNRM